MGCGDCRGGGGCLVSHRPVISDNSYDVFELIDSQSRVVDCITHHPRFEPLGA